MYTRVRKQLNNMDMKTYVMGLGWAFLFAGCSNEVLVEEQQHPQEEVQTPIGFATFADKQVRSQATDLEAYHNTLTVYGVKDNVTVQTVFDAVDLTYQAGASSPNEWTYAPIRYWDKQATYEFIAFAPASAPMQYVLHTDGKVTGGHFQTSASYTLVGQNLQSGTSNEEIYTGFTGGTGKDTDIMLAPMVPANGTTKGIVNFNFHHILSKLNVAVKLNASLGSSVVRVKNITISGLKDTGTYLDASGWTAASTLSDPDYKLQFSNAVGVEVNSASSLYFIESLVMPQAMAGTLNMEYTISTGGYEETYYYAQSLTDIFTSGTFDGESNYTVTFTISPEVITFDAGVSTWATGETVNHPID